MGDIAYGLRKSASSSIARAHGEFRYPYCIGLFNKLETAFFFFLSDRDNWELLFAELSILDSVG